MIARVIEVSRDFKNIIGDDTVAKVRHFNDRMFQRYGLLYPKKTHHYFKLPGKFVKSLPTQIMTRDGRN